MFNPMTFLSLMRIFEFFRIHVMLAPNNACMVVKFRLFEYNSWLIGSVDFKIFMNGNLPWYVSIYIFTLLNLS